MIGGRNEAGSRVCANQVWGDWESQSEALGADRLAPTESQDLNSRFHGPGRTRLSWKPESRTWNRPASTPSVAAEMLGRDALGTAVAGKAQNHSKGGRGQVVSSPVVLGASPAGPDG